MWNAIKSAASSIINAFKPKSPTPGGTVTTFKSPNMGQLSGTGNPQNNNYNPQNNNYNPQRTISGGALQGSAWAQYLAKQQISLAQAQAAREAEARRIAELQRKQAAQNALNQHKNSLLGWLQAAAQKAKDVAMAPKKGVDGLFNMYYSEQNKNKERQRLNNDTTDAMAEVNKWRRNYDKRQADIKRRLAAGEVNSDQAYAELNSEREKFLGRVKILSNSLMEREAAINKPIEGQTADWLRKSKAVLNPIGQVFGAAGKSLMWTVDQFDRFPNTAKNFIQSYTNPQAKIDTGKQELPGTPKAADFFKGVKKGDKAAEAQALARYNKAMSEWSKKQEAALPNAGITGNPWQRLQQSYGKSKDQLFFSRAGNLSQQNPVNSFVTQYAFSPLNVLPTSWAAKGLGIVGKGAGKATGFIGKTAAGKAALTAGDNVWQAAKKSKIGQGLAWLNKPVVTGNQKQFQNFITKSSSQFDSLTPGELQAYQDIMKAGGKVPKGYKMVGGGDLRKAQDLAARQKNLYDNLLKTERAAGIQTPYRYGYLPSKQDLRGYIDLNQIDPNAIKVPSFLRSKKLDDAVLNARELAFADAYRQFESAKILKKLPNQRFLSTDTSTLRRAAGMPMRAWKNIVLRANPSWYINNVLWNVPASHMAGGVRTTKAYGKILKAAVKERTLAPNIVRDLPEKVVGRSYYASEFGKLGKPSVGEKIENISRAAGFLGAKGKGMTDEAATKMVNRYLFDYGNVKNWERPLMAALPFWRWQKNITRLTATLPFTSPRWAKGLAELKKNAIDKPLEQLPNIQSDYTDPETGEKKTFTPKSFYEGKMKTPWGWVNTPFLPFTDKNLERVGVNPFLTALQRSATGKDYFGNNRYGEGWGNFIGSNFPQWNFIKNAFDSVTGKAGTEWWVSDSGYTKGKQGYNPNASNYDEKLDPTKQMWAALGRLFGSGTFVPKKFDEAKFRDNMRYKQFADEYFGHDWYKEKPNKQEREAAQKAIAEKYGYDLQRDLFDGRWSKYDTPETAALKERRKAADAMEKSWYDIYNSLPKGTGARSEFIRNKKFEMANTDLLDRFPELDFMSKVNIPGTKENYISRGKAGNSKYSKQADGSYLTEKQAFWKRYYALDKDGKKQMRASNPGMFKYGKPDPKKADFAWAYKTLPPDVRRAYLNKKYGKPSPPAEGWEAYLKARGLDFDSKLGRDLITRPELGTMHLDNVRGIISSFNKRSKDPTKDIVWAQSKRSAPKFGKKVLTFKA